MMALYLTNDIKNIFFNKTVKEISMIFGSDDCSNHFLTFTKSLETNTSVKSIFIVISNITDEYICALSSSLIKNTTLESIKITGLNMNDVCVGYIALVIKNNNNIRNIDISDCIISERGAITIGFALMDNNNICCVKIRKKEQFKVVNENIERKHSWSGWKTSIQA